MTSPTVLDAPPQSQGGAGRSFLLVFACTLIGALAQILIKQGTAGLGPAASHISLIKVVKDPALFWLFSLGILTNVRLFCGYCMLGVMTLLMAMALKGRELSRLFPIIALTYVWVTILSIAVLGEHLNFFRSLGIIFIVGGVSILGLKK
ncbi:MAG TPA: hypothetical protein VF283_10030 [Bryobacteraceae bacterium]